MAPSYCCPTAVKGCCRGVSSHFLGHDQLPAAAVARAGRSEVGAAAVHAETAPPRQPPDQHSGRVGETASSPRGGPEPVTAITVHDSRFPNTDEFNVHRDTTESVRSAATASCSLEPLAREHMFITGRRAPCHGIIHYLYEGSSSQNNTQA